MKIALAQINQSVGKIEENRIKIFDFAKKAKEQNENIIIFPEFAVTGGYSNDLFNNKDFIISEFKATEIITAFSPIHTIAGVISKDKLNQNITNAVAFFSDSNNMKVVASKYSLNDLIYLQLFHFRYYLKNLN